MKTAVLLSGILAAAVLCAAGPPAHAHEGAPAKEGEAPKKGGMPGMFPEQFLDKLTEKLSLSEAQQKKVKAVLEKGKGEKEKIEAEMKALHEKMMAHFRKTKEGIREVLDMDQKDKFDEIMAHMKGRMHGGPHPMGGPQGKGEWRRKGMGEMKGGEGPMKGEPPDDGPDDRP